MQIADHQPELNSFVLRTRYFRPFNYSHCIVPTRRYDTFSCVIAHNIFFKAANRSYLRLSASLWSIKSVYLTDLYIACNIVAFQAFTS